MAECSGVEPCTCTPFSTPTPHHLPLLGSKEWKRLLSKMTREEHNQLMQLLWKVVRR